MLNLQINDKLNTRIAEKETVKMLPESEQELANQLIKRIVLAWDPDYTKLTPEEKKQLEEAEQRIDSGDYVRDNDIDW